MPILDRPFTLLPWLMLVLLPASIPSGADLRSALYATPLVDAGPVTSINPFGSRS